MKVENRSDGQLLEAFAGGERAALGELARRYERALLGFTRGLLCSASERVASDAVQETWLRVIHYADSFDDRSGFKTWLYRIAINQCRSQLAARPADAAASNALDGQPGRDVDPPELAQNHELAEQVRVAVAHLPSEKREILLLCYHGGMTHEQAAEILEIPLGTLKSRLNAALRELRERLSAELKP